MRTPILAFLLVFAVLSPSALADKPRITGEYAVEDGLRVLRLWGSPRERGFAQGYLLGPVITGPAGLPVVVAAGKGRYEDRLVKLVEVGFTFSPAEEEELEGMLAGIRARVPAEARVIAGLAREISLVDLKVLNTFGDWYALGCSTATVWGGLSPDGKPVVVRNFDFKAMDALVRHQHLKVVVPGPEEKGARGWVGISHPGSAGAFTGMSEEGLFVAVHDVWIVPLPKDLRQPNVPRLLALKRIAAGVPARGAVETARDRCRSWHTLFGNNFLVATPDPGNGVPAGVLEYDTREGRDNGVALRSAVAPKGEANREFLICTNHHRMRGRGLCLRYNALYEGCRAPRDGPFGVAALLALAERAAVPRPGITIVKSDFGTLHQVAALTGSKTLHVRMVAPAGNIRDAETVKVEVPAALDAVRKLAGN